MGDTPENMFFEFRRHSIKDGAKSGTIGPKGCALARAVGAAQLRGCRYNHYFASGLWRTHQTLAAFDEGAGDFGLYQSPTQPPFYLMWPEVFDLWRYCHKASKRGEDMLQAAIDYDKALVDRASAEISRLFMEWAATLPSNTNALIVGHSPSMEMILYGMLGVQMPSLKECQGFRLILDEDSVAYDWKSPTLDPSAIRKSLFTDPSL